MGRQKKQIIEDNTIKEIIGTTTMKDIVEFKKEYTIFDKYNKYIIQSQSNYLTDIKYEEVMEMLRYTEKKLNIKYAVNMSCANCLLKLIKLFASLNK